MVFARTRIESATSKRVADCVVVTTTAAVTAGRSVETPALRAGQNFLSFRDSSLLVPLRPCRADERTLAIPVRGRCARRKETNLERSAATRGGRSPITRDKIKFSARYIFFFTM